MNKVEQLRTYLRVLRYACMHKKLLGLKHSLSHNTTTVCLLTKWRHNNTKLYHKEKLHMVPHSSFFSSWRLLAKCQTPFLPLSTHLNQHKSGRALFPDEQVRLETKLQSAAFIHQRIFRSQLSTRQCKTTHLYYKNAALITAYY